MNEIVVKLFNEAKRRAKVKGIPFTLRHADIKVPEFCPCLGIPLKPCKGYPGDNSPTLDRVNNELGYHRWNIKVISYKANMLKGNAKLEELRQIVAYMEVFSPNVPEAYGSESSHQTSESQAS